MKTSAGREIVLFDGSEESAGRYASAVRVAGLRLFRIEYLPVGRQMREPGFDAMYWPLVGAERWNVKPIEDVIQLVHTSDKDRAEGWPDYILAGLALSQPNTVDVHTGFRTWARALLSALKTEAASEVRRIKVSTDIIRLSELTPLQAAEILRDAERRDAGIP